MGNLAKDINLVASVIVNLKSSDTFEKALELGYRDRPLLKEILISNHFFSGESRIYHDLAKFIKEYGHVFSIYNIKVGPDEGTIYYNNKIIMLG